MVVTNHRREADGEQHGSSVGGSSGVDAPLPSDQPPPPASSSSKGGVRAKTKVRVQVRADGPTKVLELVEETASTADNDAEQQQQHEDYE